MKILLMADLVPNPDSGAAGTEYQTVEALRRLGHQVDAVWADSLPHRVTHGNLHYLLELPLAYRKTMLERIRAARYDVIHVNQPHGYLAARALLERREKAVFVHRSHGLELLVAKTLAKWRTSFDAGESRAWGRVQASRAIAALLARHSRLIAKYASGHIVSASDCAKFLRDECSVPSERICLVAQAAPRDYLNVPAPAMTKQRQRRFLYVGQYAYVKAPMIVAEVFNRLAERDDEARFTWVTSKASHAEVRSMLQKTASRRLTLMDWMPQSNLMEVYDRHGIFLFPSFFEGFGKAFLEAMSRGLCVVAADNGGAKDVIRHGKDGLLVPTGEVAQMTQTCLDLLGSFDKIQVLAQQAAMRAREYTWERAARETATFYEVLLHNRGRSAA